MVTDIVLAVLFISFQGISGSSINCKNYGRECDDYMPVEIVEEFDRTGPKDLDKFCPPVLGVLNCSSAYRAACRSEYGLQVLSFYKKAEEICGQTPLHEDYERYYDCVYSLKPNVEMCITLSSNVSLPFGRIYLHSKTLERYNTYKKTQCLLEQLVFNCSREFVQRRCGDEAVRTVENIMRDIIVPCPTIPFEEYLEAFKEYVAPGNPGHDAHERLLEYGRNG